MATQPSDSSKQRPRATVADELAVIVQRAQAFTNASGAAIAISEGQADEIICRARSGASAPDIGTALRVEGTFTGICIQSGKELRCDDAETDTRVDTVAIRSLGIRSMVVTPIKEDNKATGVLAVFAPTPHAFTITHVAVLKTMADQISALLARERGSPREEGHSEPSAVAIPKPPVAAPLPPPVLINPSVTSSAAAAAPALARVNVSTPAPKIASVKPAPAAAEKKNEPANKNTNTPKNEPPAKPSPASPSTVAMGSGPSRISQGNTQPQSPDVAPSLAVGGNSSTALSSLAKSAGGPAPAVMARSEFTPIEPISQPHAVYPDIAKARRITGTVAILVTVGKDGKVSNPRFKTGPLVFR